MALFGDDDENGVASTALFVHIRAAHLVNNMIKQLHRLIEATGGSLGDKKGSVFTRR